MKIKLGNGGTVTVLESGAIHFQAADGRTFRIPSNGRTPQQSAELIRRNAWGTDVRFSVS